MKATLRPVRLLGGFLVLSLASCDYDPNWLFAAQYDEAPALYELFAEDGEGPLVPVDINNREDADRNTIYAEVGASATAAAGGVTFNFMGTGGDVCVLVDPESATWTEAISPRLDEDSRPWSYPDNLFDDGDLDIYGGLSVYYTGSADEIGDFRVRYEDPLGNPVEVSLSVCDNTSLFEVANAHAGRGTAESCTLNETSLGVEYTVVLETWSTPLDDDRLSFGLLLANGDCGALQGTLGGTDEGHSLECMITGEALRPEGRGPWYGRNAVNDLIWGPAVQGAPDFLRFEEEYCEDPSGGRMDLLCEDEADAVLAAGSTCDWFGEGTGDVHCFCGDTSWSPEPGAI